MNVIGELGLPVTDATQSYRLLRRVYVAQTAKEPQGRLERFQSTLARRLGPLATVVAVGGIHLTYLESKGMQPYFLACGYNSDNVQEFTDDLESHLEKTCPTHDDKVTVNPKQPLTWKGFRLLALNVEPTDQLLAARYYIESFLVHRFGELPELADFEPHMVVGRYKGRMSRRIRDNPMEVLPGGMRVPGTVAMNGMSVYLDRINPDWP